MAEPGYLDVFGHEEIKRRLARAIEAGRLPQSLLLHGPRGVGKQRLALWAAAALNCQSPASRPCGECRSCRLAARLQHPDIHWFFPLPRPKRASGPEQLRHKLEDLRATALEDRRSNLFYADDQEDVTGIYVAVVHTMRRLAQMAPAMGPAKVLVIGRAEEMVPQAGNAEAANAVLKLLEEPPDDTTLILTSDVPGALLPTIRSRLQAVRVPPMPTEQVASYLAAALDLPPAEARTLAGPSGGSIGVALERRDRESDDARGSAVDLVRAMLDGRPVAHLSVAHGFRSIGARGSFTRVLSEARNLLRDLLATSAGASAADPDTATRLAGGTVRDPGQLVQAFDALDDARELADRNVNPQLIVVNLLRRARVSNRESPVRHAGRAGRS